MVGELRANLPVHSSADHADIDVVQSSAEMINDQRIDEHSRASIGRNLWVCGLNRTIVQQIVTASSIGIPTAIDLKTSV